MAAFAPRVAVIVTTYNWPEALRRVLESAMAQSERAFEIVVADDGSEPETAHVVEAVLGRSPQRWCHVWHGDSPFRQSRVKNLGVRVSRAPYLIFIDHDVLLHRDFVADHLRMAREGTVLLGKRCFLPPDYSERLLANGLNGAWWPSPWLKALGNRKNAVHLPWLGSRIAQPRTFETVLRGCNLSVSRPDFLRVDGFDETYDGIWGREDSDFSYRLFHAGVVARNLWFQGLQAHLHHPTRRREGRDRLDDELDRVRQERRIRALRGFSRMNDEGVVVAASENYDPVG